MNIVILTGIDCSPYLERIKSIDAKISIIVPLKISEPLLPNNTCENIRNHGVDLYEVAYEEHDILEVLGKVTPDVIISIGWRRILSPELIAQTKLFLNIHPAILPQYKGYHTEPYVIINGESEHGITAHVMTEGLDEGDIVLQQTFPISKFSTIDTLKNKVTTMAPEFFEQLINKIINERLEFIKQDHSKTIVIAGKRKPTDSEIDPSKSIIDLFDVIRASNPTRFPSYFYYEGKKVGISLFTIDGEKEDPDDL